MFSIFTAPCVRSDACPVRTSSILLLLLILATTWIAACDKDGITGPDLANRAPVAVGTIPAQTIGAGETVTVDVSPYFSDPDGDILTYSARTSDADVATASASGSTVTIGAAAQKTGTVSAQTLPVDTTGVSSGYLDMEKDASIRAIEELHRNRAAAIQASGSTVTIAAAAQETVTVTVTARDPDGLSATQEISVTVDEVNQAPEAVGTIPTQTVDTGQTVEVDATPWFSDPDDDELTYEATTLDSNVATVTVSGSIVTVEGVAQGAAKIEITASDPGGLSAMQSFETMVEGAQTMVAFETNTLASPEGATVMLNIVASSPMESAVMLHYTLGVDMRTGTEDADEADYTDVTGGSVEIEAGSSSGVIEIAINDDDDIEPTLEVFTVTLNAPGEEDGYVLGSPASVSVRIREGVCDRTPQVRDEIVQEAGRNECTEINDQALIQIRELFLLEGGTSVINVEAKRNYRDILEEQALAMRSEECASSAWASGDDDDLRRPQEKRSACEPGALTALKHPERRQDGSAGAGDVITSLREGDFDGLVNLRELVLSYNQLSELPPNVFSDLDNLEVLLLDNNLLEALPANVFSGLSDLEFLWLNNNRLVNLPAKAFPNLSNLIFLWLHENRLTAIPDGVFSDLDDLLELTLSGNQLTSLPSGIFSGLTSLQRLFLKENQLTVIPADAFTSLSKLQRLWVHENQIDRLSTNVFRGLHDLEELRLSGNGIANLPADVFENLGGLQRLGLGANQITELPAGVFSGLTSLQRLHAPDNRIADLPADIFSGLTNLELLDLEMNQLTELPAGIFSGLASMRALALKDNPGAPFTFNLKMRRTDSEDLLEPGPAAVDIHLAEAAPFFMEIPLSVHGGALSPDAALLEAGNESSTEITVSRDADSQAGVQVAAGPIPKLPSGVTGVEFEVPDPVVLFGLTTNNAPVAEREMPWMRFRAGDAAESVIASTYFRDPEGYDMTYAATVDDPGVASAHVAGERIAVSPLGGGSTKVTVTATDTGNLSVESVFLVSVREDRSGSFDIDLLLLGPDMHLLGSVLQDAASWWMSILADTEFPDVPVTQNSRLGCAGYESDQQIGTIDDLAIVIAAERVDGERGVLAFAGPCSIRDESYLPITGVVVIDADDIAWLRESGNLEEVILHEIGHVLGIGVIWHDLDLIQNLPSSREEEADVHFTGPLAIEAFDEAGGANYTGGAKVPVASRGAHWRESVLDDELMTPFLNSGVLNPLSPITAQSLADMGYTVNEGQAELYRLPGAAAAKQGASRKIPYGNDILRETIQVIDRNGRVVRVIEQ